MSQIRIRQVLIVIGFVALSIAVGVALPGCGSEGGGGEIEAAFQEAAPRPAWWDRVDAKECRTYDELLAYWQDDERTPNEFFKAAYQAVLDYPEDEDLVMLAISLMPHGDSAYPHTTALLEFAVKHYFDYARPLHNYGGESGDTVAGIVRQLATIYNRSGNYGQAVVLVERLLAAREPEVNDQLLELISLQYAEALHNYGRTPDAVAWLDGAIDKYHGDWEEKLVEKRDEIAAR